MNYIHFRIWSTTVRLTLTCLHFYIAFVLYSSKRDRSLDFAFLLSIFSTCLELSLCFRSLFRPLLNFWSMCYDLLIAKHSIDSLLAMFPRVVGDKECQSRPADICLRSRTLADWSAHLSHTHFLCFVDNYVEKCGYWSILLEFL